MVSAIVPPTADRIEQFVSCAGRRADEEIAVSPPARLRATPRNIAANAIMAGCEPQHMPLLIAATEALAAEESMSTISAARPASCRFCS